MLFESRRLCEIQESFIDGRHHQALAEALQLAFEDPGNLDALILAGNLAEQIKCRRRDFLSIFPVEITSQIFNYLTTAEVANLQLVSRAWRNFVLNRAPQLWEVLDFRTCRGPSVADDALQECVRRARGRVRVICLPNPAERDYQCSVVVTRNSRLLRDMFRLTTDDLERVRLLTNLKELHIESYTELFSSTISYFDDMVDFLARLEKLTIEITNLSELLDIIDAGAPVTNLHTLRAVYSRCTPTASEKKIELLTCRNPFRENALNNLRRLEISGYRWREMDDDGAAVKFPRGSIVIGQLGMMRLIAMATGLRWFAMTNIVIESDGRVGHYPLDFRCCSVLEEVSIRWGRFEHLPAFPASTKRLALDFCTIGDPRLPLPTTAQLAVNDQFHADAAVETLSLQGTLDPQRNIYCALSADSARQMHELLTGILGTYGAKRTPLCTLDLSSCPGLRFPAAAAAIFSSAPDLTVLQLRGVAGSTREQAQSIMRLILPSIEVECY